MDVSVVFLLVTIFLDHAHGTVRQKRAFDSRSRMDIPMGTPDLDDKFSDGLASFIGTEALPGSNRGLFGAPAGGAAGRSNGGSSDINALYDNFQMPVANTNTNTMRKWYGPEFAPPRPPMPPQGALNQGPQNQGPPNQGPGALNFFMPPPQQQDQPQHSLANDGCEYTSAQC